jgi:hypothetical protein
MGRRYEGRLQNFHAFCRPGIFNRINTLKNNPSVITILFLRLTFTPFFEIRFLLKVPVKNQTGMINKGLNLTNRNITTGILITAACFLLIFSIVKYRSLPLPQKYIMASLLKYKNRAMTSSYITKISHINYKSPFFKIIKFMRTLNA